MAFNQRQSGIFLSYIGEAVKIVSGLLYTPIMLRLLGQSEYGLYQLVNSVVSYLGLLSFGFGSAYIKYYSQCKAENDEKGISKLNGMFMLIFSFLSLLCLLCGSIMVLHADSILGSGLTAGEITKARILLAIMVVNMALTFPNVVFNCYVTAHEKFIFQKTIRILQNVLNPFLALPLMIAGFGSIAVVVVSTVLTFAVFASNVFYCKKRLGISFSFHGLELSKLNAMWIFTFFIFLNQLIDQINWNVDKILLGRMSGTAAVAIYGVGAQINTMYVQTSTAISNVFIPKVNRIVSESNDNKELTDLMIRVGRMQFVILALVVSGFVFFGKPFIEMWAGHEYYEAYYIVLLLIIPATVPLVQNLGIEVQRAKNKHKARSIVYFCVAISNVVISIPLIYVWGVIGAAVGTMISLVCGNILFMNWYYQKKLNLDIVRFWKSLLSFIPAIVLVIIYGVIYCYFIEITGWLLLAISIITYSGVYFAVMWLFGFNSSEKRLMISLINRKLQR